MKRHEKNIKEPQRCLVCNRPLSNSRSIANMIGPTCQHRLNMQHRSERFRQLRFEM